MPDPASSTTPPRCGLPVLLAKHPELRRRLPRLPRTAAEAGGVVPVEDVQQVLREPADSTGV